jgi:hypothetical protein
MVRSLHPAWATGPNAKHSGDLTMVQMPGVPFTGPARNARASERQTRPRLEWGCHDVADSRPGAITHALEPAKPQRCGPRPRQGSPLEHRTRRRLERGWRGCGQFTAKATDRGPRVVGRIDARGPRLSTVRVIGSSGVWHDAANSQPETIATLPMATIR